MCEGYGHIFSSFRVYWLAHLRLMIDSLKIAYLNVAKVPPLRVTPYDIR